MKKIRNFRDIEHQLDLIEIQKEVNLEKLKGGIEDLKSSLLPSLVAFSFKKLFQGKKKRKRMKKEYASSK